LIAVATQSTLATAIDGRATDVKSSSSLAIQPSALLTIDQNRTTVVDRVVSHWGDALAGSDAGLDKDQLRALLTGLRSDQLLAASLAGSLDGLRNVIANALTTNAPVAAGLVHPKALGDAVADLVYTPVTPCRIVDTRSVGGAFAGGGETRSYHAFLTSGTFASQGGAASNCGIPANPGAAALNITVVGGSNFLTVWQYGVSQPTASTLNPRGTGEIGANGAIVPLCQPNCPFEFSVFAFGPQLVVDIVGYFKAPGPPSVKYVDNGDGTVTDNTTGLMWEKKLASSNAACTSATQASRDARCQQNSYTWTVALTPYTEPTGTLFSDFLEKLNDLKTANDGTATPCFASHCDWRIPTIGELRSIVSAAYPTCVSSPCIDPIFGPTQASFHWSSSSVPSNQDRAWGVYFSDGGVTSGQKSLELSARAVRGAR
jgi:hypothetical protein